jgi:SAM-dependent methyltransferase
MNGPNAIGRLRSRQAGRPSGLLGRIIGRAMVKDTAPANDRAFEALDLTPNATVLEIGFGQGRTVQMLTDAGHQVIGVDVSETMVSQARARNRTACRSGQARLQHTAGVAVPFDDASADAAITVHTLYFMADPAATLTDVARVLRPGGRLAIAARVGDDPMPTWMDPTIYRIPTVTEIRHMLDAAGFGQVDDQGAIDGHLTHLFVAAVPA